MGAEFRRFGLRNLLALGLLAGWTFVVAAYGPDPGFPGRALGELAAGLGRIALWFVPVGVLVPLALPRMRGLFSTLFVILIPSVVLAAAITVLAVAAPDEAPWALFESFQFPTVLDLLAPAAGAFAGVLLGTVLARGLGAALLLIPALLGIGAALLAIVAVALLVLTDRVAAVEPVGVPAPTAADYHAAFSTDPGGRAGESRLALSPDAFASALRLAVAAGGLAPGTRIAFAAEGDELRGGFSLPWTIPWAGERFVNVGAVARPSFEDGAFRARVRSFSIGDLTIPPGMVRPASRILSRWLRRGSPLAPVLDEMQRAGAELAVEESALVVRRPVAATPSGPVGDYVARLERDAGRIRSRPDRLVGALEAVFHLAAERSESIAAIPHNRAAILALGGAAGHPALLSLAGFPEAAGTARGLDERMGLTLGGRRDWARHFLLSAGLSQIGPDGLSERAGLIKEQLDAAMGGSGFSFADLLMDAAGRRFAAAATATEPSAREIQAAVLAGVVEDDLAPGNTGLPEGLSSERLEAELGGFDGEAFLALEAEITGRLDALPLYQVKPSRDAVPPPTLEDG